MLSFLIAISLGQLIAASAFLSPRSGLSDNIPPACQDDCSELNTILQSCSTTSCFCTQLFLSDFATCFICVGKLSGANFDTPQTTLNQLVEECEEAGTTLSPILLPGETTLPTAPPPPPPASSKAPQTGGNKPNPAGVSSEAPAPAPALVSTSTQIVALTPTSTVITLTSSSSTSQSSLSSTATSNSTTTTTTTSQSATSASSTSTQPAQTQSSDNDTSSPSDTLPPAPTATNGSNRIKFAAPVGILMAAGGLFIALS